MNKSTVVFILWLCFSISWLYYIIYIPQLTYILLFFSTSAFQNLCIPKVFTDFEVFQPKILDFCVNMLGFSLLLNFQIILVTSA